MQNRMIYANIYIIYIIYILKKIGLTFIVTIKNQIHLVRAHVTCPSTNHYNSLPGGTIPIYFDPADTSLPWLQLCHLFFFV